MAATIWKFVLDHIERQVMEVPRGTRFISAAWDPKVGPCVWGEVPEPTAPCENRGLLVVGTGFDLPPNRGRFLGTVVMLVSGLVWHIYEEGP